MTEEADAEPTTESDDSSDSTQPAERSDSAETGVDEPETEAAGDEEMGTDTVSAEDSGGEAEGSDESEPEPAGSLVERVGAHDEELAEAVRTELDARETEIAAREADIEELESKLKRKQADFQNFKKRQQQKVADRVARATEDLVENLLPVRDNLARALEQGADTDIREGVEGTLRELDRVLEDEGVSTIEPTEGDQPDPERHEVMMRVESDQPAGAIAELYRPGYEMTDRVIRTAQVTVSDDEDA